MERRSVRFGYSPDATRPLTPRMCQVLASAAGGRTVAETAAELGLSEATVWAIRAAAFERLGAHTITGAITAARNRAELAA